MRQPLASLSLDLDNKWSYLKTHGDSSWQHYPSYLSQVVPTVLAMLDRLELPCTFFVVGQDVSRDENRGAFEQLAASSHELANHSYQHEPWFHRYSRAQITEELARTEEALARFTTQPILGFRGPGFSLSLETLEVLAERGYRYDASTFPTFLGPLARLYYFRRARLEQAEKQDRELLFGTLRDGLRPLRGYKWRELTGPNKRELLEIPVTTAPLAKTPIHCSYLLYLAGYSAPLARLYFKTALGLCRLAGVTPSLLLHPLDFLGGDTESDLSFFPAMNQTTARKCELMEEFLALYKRHFDVTTMAGHADALDAQGAALRRVTPKFSN